eukprot:symbB.v1.2.028469.t1/scaffold3006.1/size65522/2
MSMGHELLSPEEIMGYEEDEVQILSAVAWWPVGDLLIATDYGDTQHAAGEFEPVMYLSLDSYALVDAAPRESVVSVLDICCGSGVQGLVALRHYAKEATFLDVNPRAISFSCFNAAVNGLHQHCNFVEGSILKDMCPKLRGKTFDVILANPPFALVQKGLTLLAPSGRLCSVAEVPNPEAFPKRVRHWLEQAGCNKGCVKIFTGKTIAAEQYWKTATQDPVCDRSPLEWRRYLSGLQRLGVTSVAEALLLLTEDSSTSLSIDAVSRETLWQDVNYLRTQVYADDFINQDSHDAPLSTLPVQDSFDICHEISREEMREAVERLKGVSAAKEAPAILASFSEDIPNVTIFEVCSRVGHGELLRDLQSAAQARLRHLIFEGTATMQQVFRLLRAGADPTRQNLSCFVNLQGEAKRARIEMGPEKGTRGASLSGTPLHWVCWATGRVPSQRQQHYLEICRWLCDIAPLALFLKNDNQQTPLELLMAQSPSPGGASGGELRCSRCGQSGHVEKECLRAPAEPSKMLVAALARGLSKAMQQYPLLSASCLVDGGGLRKAVGTARELLLQGDDAVDTRHGLGRMDELLEVISEERRMLQQLADEQYATMGRCMRASFARIEDLDAIKGGGNVLRKTETNHANQKLQARDDPLQPALEWATEETDHEHHHRPQSQMSHMTTTKSEATTENLHLYEGMADRGKAYTDVLAGTLVLLNSFVMLIELEIEGQAVGALLSGGHGPKLADVSPIFKTLDGIFVFVFLAELLMRIGIERKKFIYDAANWRGSAEHRHAANGKGLEVAACHPLGPHLQVLSRTANAGESMLLLFTILGMVNGVAGGFYVDGNFGFGQLIAGLHHG